MTFYHGKSNRKPSGGKDNSHRLRDKRLAEKGSDFTATTIGKEEKIFVVLGRGNSSKAKTRFAKEINLTLKNGKTVRAQITNVKENPANRNYARAQKITKGALIEAKAIKGNENYLAKVTSRPGQVGQVSAIEVTK